MTRHDRRSPILRMSDCVARTAHSFFVDSPSGAQKEALESGHLLTYPQTLLGARRSIFIHREVIQYAR